MSIIILLLGTLLLPLSYTYAVAAPTDLKSFLGLLTGLINLILPIIFGLTVIVISWGVIRAWIMGDATSEDIERGKKVALVGIVALTVMLSIWGILNLLRVSIFG